MVLISSHVILMSISVFFKRRRSSKTDQGILILYIQIRNAREIKYSSHQSSLGPLLTLLIDNEPCFTITWISYLFWCLRLAVQGLIIKPKPWYPSNWNTRLCFTTIRKRFTVQYVHINLNAWQTTQIWGEYHENSAPLTSSDILEDNKTDKYQTSGLNTWNKHYSTFDLFMAELHTHHITTAQ